MKKTKNNTWAYQYLDNEYMYYLTESHIEDGIVGEYYFNTFSELETFVIENNIPIFLYENVNIEDVTNMDEFNFAQLGISVFDFRAVVNMYGCNINQKAFKANYQMTLELIRYAPEEALGAMLKRMLQDLDKHIQKERNNE